MPRPYEMVSGPLTVYTAPLTRPPEPGPALNLAPPAPWSLLGTNGGRTISEDGLSIEFTETVEAQRVLGSTAIQKLFRTEEDLMLSCALLDVSVETFALAMSGLPVESVAGTSTPTDFLATPVPTITVPLGTAGNGAVVGTLTLTSGDITAVTWTPGGRDYAVGDILTFTQGQVTGTYTVLAANIDVNGVLQDLSGVTIAGAIVSAAYRQTRLLRGFNVLNLSFLAKGFSPYADNAYAQYWVPQAYASFSGSLSYTKGEAAMIELEIMAIEDSSGGVDPITQLATPGYGQYQGQIA